MAIGVLVDLLLIYNARSVSNLLKFIGVYHRIEQTNIFSLRRIDFSSA